MKKQFSLADLEMPSKAQIINRGIKEENQGSIAVIGMDVRISNTNGADEFWKNISDGEDLVSELSYTRKDDIKKALNFIGQEVKDDDLSKGAFLDEIDLFDYKFFHITPNEAAFMSPDHRLFLQTVWRAVEDAGYTKKLIQNTKTGIFMGYSSLPFLNTYYDYSRFIMEVDESMGGIALPGNLNSMIASRISHILNLKGPSLTIDTACSSSLVAVYQACQSIRNKECDMAIAGTVKIDLTPLKKNKMGIESSDEKARTFDNASDGTGKGEGVAALILKDYDKAIADNDNIYCVIKGGAINHDGTSIGLTAPNVSAQKNVIISAWENSHVDPESIQYIEAHGTGTTLGDPIEISGITQAFTTFTDKKQFCGIGALKTNIGHLDHAAGMMGLIKAILSLKNKQVPASLHFHYPNEKINFEESPVYVNTRLREWPENIHNTLRRCGVSAFGFSGTNCHLILEEYRETEVTKDENTEKYIFKLTAKNRESLKKIVKKMELFLNEDMDISRVCYTATVCRNDYDCRYAIVTDTIADLREKISYIMAEPFTENRGLDIYYGETNKSQESQIKECVDALKREICEQYVSGCEIDWKSLFKKDIQKMSLPLYEFSGNRCWLVFTQNGDSTIQDTFSEVIVSDAQGNEITEVERKTAYVWAKVLGYNQIDINEDFYELGGDSLIASRLINQINGEFNQNIQVSDFLTAPTVRKLASLLGETKEIEGKDVIEKQLSRDSYVLSTIQKQVYAQAMFGGIGTSLNTPIAIQFNKKLNPTKVQEVANVLVERHEAFKTIFVNDGIDIVQKIDKNATVVVNVMENSGSVTSSELLSSLVTPFDLSTAPLLRVFLIENTDSHTILFDMHHIISDGTSCNIFVKEFVDLYQGLELKQLEYTLKDFACYENSNMKSQSMIKQENYWRDVLEGEIPVITLPYKVERKSIRSFEGKKFNLLLEGNLAEQINSVAKVMKVTLNTLLFSAYTLMLSKASKQDDIIVSTTVSGRTRREMEHIIGAFINVLPIRCKLNKDMSCEEFIHGVHNNLMRAYDNQDYQYYKMIEMVRSRLDNSRNPIFDTGFIFHNEYEHNNRITLYGAEGFVEPILSKFAQLDIKLDIYRQQDNGLLCVFEYKDKLFEEECISDMASIFKSALTQFIDEKMCTLDSFPAKKEQEQIEPKTLSKSVEVESPKHIVVSATFTAEPMETYLKWWSNKLNMDIDVKFTDYNQVFMELINEDSMLSHNIGINMILVRFEDWVRFDNTISDMEKCIKVQNYYNEFMKLIKTKNKNGTYLLAILPPTPAEVIGYELNMFITNLIQTFENDMEEVEDAYLVDCRNIATIYNVDKIHDQFKNQQGHIPYTDEFYVAIASEFVRKIVALRSQRFKVIALDCDNTIWQGICGEEPIVLDQEHIDFQKFLVKKYNEGMLIVLCSKNNESDVWNVFDNNIDMVLKKEHLVDFRINWKSKSENINELASELNLGISSFIFIDDSNLECMDMLKNCPEVLTIQMPEEKREIVSLMEHVWAFDRVNITDEDRNRTSMYVSEKSRNKTQQQISNSYEYLKNLELKMVVNRIQSSDISRASQLTLKTNQFNLSTKRYCVAELDSKLKEEDVIGWTVQVKDRFGIYGQVGVAIAEIKNDILYVDTFLLSCRVLGRQVEHAIMMAIAGYCRKNSINTIKAEFIPTSKNVQVKQFLDENKWESSPLENGHLLYIKKVNEFDQTSEYVEIFFEDNSVDFTEEDKKVEDSKSILTNKIVLTPEEVSNLTIVADLSKTDWTGKLTVSANSENRQYYLPLTYPTSCRIIDEMNKNSEIEMTVSDNYCAPRNEKEEEITQIWRSVLKRDKIGIYDKFFKIGGTSLLAIQIISKIAMKMEAQLTDIFEYDTIASFAENIPYKENYLLELFDTKVEMAKRIEGTSSEKESTKMSNYYKENSELMGNIENIKSDIIEYKNILIAGGTGYLGAHLINAILTGKPESNIHLIIRSNETQSSEQRVEDKLNFYFGNRLFQEYRHRLFIYEGNITKECFGLSEKQYYDLNNQIDCIINTAAVVSHYGKYENSYGVNVKGTSNLVEFVKMNKRIVLHHISTLLVAFGAIKDVDTYIYTEDDYNVGQEDNNIYFKTKLEAEEVIQHAREEGIMCNIYRMGTLVYNTKTKKFQENIGSNAFYSVIKSFININMIPKFNSDVIDFSFVDYAADSFMVLFDKKQLLNRAFHIYNYNRISTLRLNEFLHEVGYRDINDVEMKELFANFSNDEIQKEVMNIVIHGGLLGNIRGTTFELESSRTKMLVEAFGIKWPKIISSHIMDMIDYCKEVGFLPEENIKIDNLYHTK